MLSANGSWFLVNFKSRLITALKSEGYEPVVVAPADPANDPKLADLGVRRIELAMDRAGTNPLTELGLLYRYWQTLRGLRPAAYLSFTIKPNIYGCLAARVLGIRAIANVTGLGTAFIKGGPLLLIVSWLYRLAFARADAVFFLNSDDKTLFVQRRIVRPDQARLVPGAGVDVDRFQPMGGPPDRLTFLLIGRVIGDKGVREYAEAARSARLSGLDARFQLLGPIDEGSRTVIPRSEIQTWVSEGLIEYLGPTNDVRPFIAGASAVVLPSYREGLPSALLEAAAMGRPLIATDVPGCREVVENGVNGFLCAARDARSLADAMMRLAELSEAERQAMGAASRGKVQERFSEQVVIRAYLDELGRFGTAPN